MRHLRQNARYLWFYTWAENTYYRFILQHLNIRRWSEDKTLRRLTFQEWEDGFFETFWCLPKILPSEFQLNLHNMCLCVFLSDYFHFCNIFSSFESQHELSSLVSEIWDPINIEIYCHLGQDIDAPFCFIHAKKKKRNIYCFFFFCKNTFQDEVYLRTI